MSEEDCTELLCSLQNIHITPSEKHIIGIDQAHKQQMKSGDARKSGATHLRRYIRLFRSQLIDSTARGQHFLQHGHGLSQIHRWHPPYLDFVSVRRQRAHASTALLFPGFQEWKGWSQVGKGKRMNWSYWCEDKGQVRFFKHREQGNITSPFGAERLRENSKPSHFPETKLSITTAHISFPCPLLSDRTTSSSSVVRTAASMIYLSWSHPHPKYLFIFFICGFLFKKRCEGKNYFLL